MAYRLHDSLGFRLSRAARIQERRLDQGLKALGLTRLTWCILLAVGNEGLSQPSDIAAFVGVNRSAISRALRQMEEAGLVSCLKGMDDKRTRSVSMTSKGETLLAKGTPIAEQNNMHMHGRLGEDGVARLKAQLDRLIEGEPALPKL